MATTASKLLIKPSNRVAILPPAQGSAPDLGELPDGVHNGVDPANADVVIFFVTSRDEQLQRQEELVNAVRPGAIVWFCYPKKSGSVASDLSRDVVWKTLKPTGWRPVTNVSIDDTWSALRMRPFAEVGK